jgi:hypothetical protein
MELAFHGKADFKKAVVTIGDLSGNRYDRFEWSGETTTLNLAHLPKGIYYVEININGNTDVRKIVIQ